MFDSQIRPKTHNIKHMERMKNEMNDKTLWTNTGQKGINFSIIFSVPFD